MPGVIFDLDGVLIDSEGLQYKAYSRVLAQWQIAVTKEQYAEHWIAAGRGPEYAAANLGMPISADELRDLKHPVYHDILCREVTLMPAALAALERLSAEFPMALATNSNKLDVDFVMERFGLRRFFQHLVGREDYLGAKPMPDAFLTAAERLGLPPSQCVVIEDAHKGILAAHRAGTPVIAVPNWWTRNNDFSLASRVVTSLAEVSPDTVRELTIDPSAK